MDSGASVERPVGVAAAIVPRVTGISGGLGLVDVEFEVRPGEVDRAEVRWRVKDVAERVAEVVRLRTIERPSADGQAMELIERWGVRLHEPGAAVLVVRLSVTRADGAVEEVGPFNAVTEPESAQRTPDWAKGAVWYQIFPERFANGNTANDPRGPAVFKPGWNEPWERVTVEELEAARARGAARFPAVVPDPARLGGQLYNLVFQRRYGGDLQGVVQRLEHVADLGATALYLTPIFRAPSMHKYDTADYLHIDEAFGHATSAEREPTPGETLDPKTWTWTQADRFVLDTLLPQARERGLRVIFDGVWNHVGREHFAFQDVLENGDESPFAAWFDGVYHRPGPGAATEGPLAKVKPGTLLSWRAWDRRNGDLPALKQTRERDLAAGPKAHVMDVTRRWLAPDGDPTRGIDGWRLDVAADLGLAFWRDWRAMVKQVKPEAALFGEVWFPAERFFGGAAFDGQMNYPLAVPLTRWLATDPAFTSQQLARVLEEVFVNHPATDLVQMNLLGSHDTDRLASLLNNPGLAYDSGAGPRTSPTYRAGRPGPEVYELVRLAVALQATYLGSPMIYAGDEWGVFGADDPDCRKPIPWPDLGPRVDRREDADVGLRDDFRRWLRLRQDPALGAILRFGNLRHLATGDPAVFAFERRLNGAAVGMVLNRGSTEFVCPAGWGYSDEGGKSPWVLGRAAGLLMKYKAP